MSEKTSSTNKGLHVSEALPETSNVESNEDHQPWISKFDEIEKKLSSGTSDVKLSVRELLKWFDAQRRRAGTVERIRQALDKHNLETDPDFESVYLDADIEFKISLREEKNSNIVALNQVTSSGSSLLSSPEATRNIDPSHKISKLEAANRKPITVRPDDTVEHVINLMQLHDFSQVPVVSGEHSIKGIVTQESLLRHCFFGKNFPKLVRDAMDHEAQTISVNESIFRCIDRIVQHGYLLVQQADKTLSGIITLSDIGTQFRTLSEPFLTIGEIENQLRKILSDKISMDDLKTVLGELELTNIKTIADLSFGGYVRILENNTLWGKMHLSNVDRKIFIKELESVRNIRNDVMHFDPDGIEGEHLNTLRRFSSYISKIISPFFLEALYERDQQ